MSHGRVLLRSRPVACGATRHSSRKTGLRFISELWGAAPCRGTTLVWGPRAWSGRSGGGGGVGYGGPSSSRRYCRGRWVGSARAGHPRRPRSISASPTVSGESYRAGYDRLPPRRRSETFHLGRTRQKRYNLHNLGAPPSDQPVGIAIRAGRPRHRPDRLNEGKWTASMRRMDDLAEGFCPGDL